jgi:hypothetical protein
MNFRTISISTVAALLIAASQAGAQEANHHQHGAVSGQSVNDGHDEQRSGRDVWVDDAKHDERPGDP